MPYDDEYTPEQRRVLDASLAEAEKRPYYGPFKNGAEIAAFMKKRQHLKMANDTYRIHELKTHPK